MKNIPILLSLLLALPFVADAQQRGYPQFRSNNLSMAEVQPTWAGPLIQSDARLGQAIRFSVSNFKMPGAHPIVYGNNHGFNVIVHRRFQLDCDPPSFFRDHSSQKDGWGNAAAQFKMRLFSGNADHGKQVYSTICFICHQINGAGIDFGPNLSEVGSRLTKDLLYQSVLEPSAVIAPGFDTVTLKLEDSMAMGIVASENDQEVVLKAMGGAKTTYKKADIVSRTKGTNSMMPVGQQAAMTTQDLVDLIEYLSSLKKK